MILVSRMRFLTVCCVCVIIFVSLALAQPQRVNRTPPPTEEEQLDGHAASRYQLALGYLRGMQFERAIAILRDLYAEQPERKIFFDKLKEAYVDVKRYDDAVALLDDALARSSAALPELEAERAQLFYLGGDEPAAMEAWTALLRSAPDTEAVYRVVYASMIQVRLLLQAIDILKQGRRAIGNMNLFQAELAQLYNLTGQHELATQEYLDLLSINERQLNYVRSRLGRDLEQDGALEDAIRIAEARVVSEPDLRQLRDLLAWLYEQAGSFEQAFEEVIALEKDADASGQGIYQFALRAAEAGAFVVAGRAFQSAIEEYPGIDISIDARLGMADMYRLQAEKNNNLEQYRYALGAYETFLKDFPDHPQTSVVMARIGALHQDVFRDQEAAERTLSFLATRYANSPIGHQARFDLGRLALSNGNLDKAGTIFARLAGQADGELAAKARFEEAMTHFYAGNFAETQSILGSLRENMDKETANDAIELGVLLMEDPGTDSTFSALISYAQALLLFRQHKSAATALAAQDILAQWGQHPIADDVRFLRARALLLDNRPDEAMMAFGELPLIHPESPLLDRSLFYYAEILETFQGDAAGALQAYTDLLTQYPGSLLVNKVRERIRALRSAGV
ncbi:MAG: tetratricopeptide repeat protein [Rhodothermaceae bacterium]|nr:tetratricopeptide repeat protein [Rhodothermaceae bacterium]MYI84344.1 tetratricopeptide repeat protein [Rhodothermaceae bacterium]